MNRTIDFRKNGVQMVDLPWAGVSTITYEGTCPITGTRLYSCNTGNDPRGPLGVHAVEVFEAEGFDMVGPDVLCSWISCNNDQRVYKKCLAYAKRQWEVKK